MRHNNMRKRDNAKVAMGVTLYRRPGHDRAPTAGLQSLFVARNASGLSSVVSRLHAERADARLAALGRIHSCCCHHSRRVD